MSVLTQSAILDCEIVALIVFPPQEGTNETGSLARILPDGWTLAGQTEYSGIDAPPGVGAASWPLCYPNRFRFLFMRPYAKKPGQ